MGAIASFFGGIWAKLLVLLAIVAAVGAILAGARNAGRMAERAEANAKARAVSNQRRQIDDEIRRAGPGAARDRLRGWATDDARHSL